MRTEALESIRKQMDEGDIEQVIKDLEAYIQAHPDADDTPFYLLGNAFRKRGDWQQALNNYLEAIDRNAESPAVHARSMLMDILNFYNKDMYNQ
jgi:tetratricopeptide (TPR) repeat protein